MTLSAEEKTCYVGIDTSNYTTSVAVARADGRVIANLRQLLPVKEGERGLRQSDAVFAHTRNLPVLMEQLESVLHPAGEQPYRVLGVGVSAFPRRREDSYMPCFLSGIAAAKTFAAATGAPVTTFSHQEGHVMAALYSAGLDASPLTEGEPFVAFHVSGGTTDVLLVKGAKVGFDVRQIGESLDLHAGQAVDRVGVAMGLRFPCGRELERLAATCTAPVPKPRVSVDGCDCHLSGLENLALALYRKTQDAALTAAYTLDFIAETLSKITAEVRHRYGDIPLLFAGGVMSNQRIRRTITGRFDAHFAEPEFSADNAAGIALLCRHAAVRSI